MIKTSCNYISKNLVAVSFDTATFQDLLCFVKEHTGYTLTRFDPLDFLDTKPDMNTAHINLVIKDVRLRKKITQHLDLYNSPRFSLLHDKACINNAVIDDGCFIYPLASIYPNCKLEKDVIVHSSSAIGHKCIIQTGVYISGGVSIGGGTCIGSFTQLNLNSTLYDNIDLCNDINIGAGSIVRKSIKQPGTYSNQLQNKLVKIK